jgi:hypothetical protein
MMMMMMMMMMLVLQVQSYRWLSWRGYSPQRLESWRPVRSKTQHR